MMITLIRKSVLLCFLTLGWSMFSQKNEMLKLKEIIKLDADKFIGVNMFDDQFFIKDNTLFKHTSKGNYSYKNIQLGHIKNVGIVNSLQSSVFYKDFNVFVQLDKKLGELNTIDFNVLTSFNSVSYVAITSNKRLWVFNSDTQQLQVYNPKLDTVDVSTTPIQESIIKFYSNYNFCWVLSDKKLLQYNVYGNLLNEYTLNAFEDLVYYKGFFVLRKRNDLFLLNAEETVPHKIILPEIPIKDFSVTNETLYIYTGKELHSFVLNLKQTN